MGFAKRPADFENTQLKRSYLLSSNAGLTPPIRSFPKFFTFNCVTSG